MTQWLQSHGALDLRPFAAYQCVSLEQSPLSDLRVGYTMRFMGIYDMKLCYIVTIYRNYFGLGICRH